jgi:phage-related protein
MPRTRVIFYREDDGSVPTLDWLDKLPERVRRRCIVRIERLRELGHELRRPEADLLRDEIHELRVGVAGRNYRMLYFFHGNIAAVVSHGIEKERQVSPPEIDRAIHRRRKFTLNPAAHTFEE